MSFSNPAYDKLVGRLHEMRDLILLVENKVNAMVRDFESTFDQQCPEETQRSTASGGSAPGV